MGKLTDHSLSPEQRLAQLRARFGAEVVSYVQAPREHSLRLARAYERVGKIGSDLAGEITELGEIERRSG